MFSEMCWGGGRRRLYLPAVEHHRWYMYLHTRLQRVRIAQMFSFQFNYHEFMKSWQDSVPEGMTTSLCQLEVDVLYMYIYNSLYTCTVVICIVVHVVNSNCSQQALLGTCTRCNCATCIG